MSRRKNHNEICSPKLRRRRYSHTQPNHNPKTPSPRTLIHSAWKSKQAPRNYQNDTGMQSEILLSGSRTQNQSLGNQLPRLHCQQKNWHETDTSHGAKQYWIFHGTRRLFRSRYTIESAFFKRIPTHHNDDGRFLSLPLGLPDTRHDSKNSGKMHNWCHGKALLPTNRQFNGQRITVQIGGSQPNSSNIRHTDKPGITETCPNDRHTRTNTCFIENFTKNINGRRTLHVARICSNCSHEL